MQKNALLIWQLQIASHRAEARWIRHISVIWSTLDQAPLVQPSQVQAQKSTLDQAHFILGQTHNVPDPAHFVDDPALSMIQRMYM